MVEHTLLSARLTEFAPTFWARFWRRVAPPYVSALVRTTGLTITRSDGPEMVPFRDLDRVEWTRGRLWVRLTLYPRHGDPLVLSGLAKRQADAFHETLATAVETYRRQVEALMAGVPRLTQTFRRIQALTAGTVFIAHHMAAEAQEDLAPLAALLDLPDELLEEAPSLTQMIGFLRDFRDHPAARCQAANDRFILDEQARFREFFDTVEKNPLTGMQRRAVVTHEDNTLVVAGAGSGKTSVILAKTGYLLRKGLADPDGILLLAFNRRAASEMSDRLKERLGAEVTASTFHSLGLAIIAQVEGRKPALSALSEDEKALRTFIQDSIEVLVTDEAQRAIVFQYFQSFFAPYKSPFDFQEAGDYFRYIKEFELRSLQGELCRSFEECEIANFLYLNGIRYEYERAYPVDVATVDFRQYRPDFYLTDPEIYLEHFALREDGSTPPFIDPIRYRDGVAWKRQCHQTHGTTLWETYTFQKADGTLLPLLEKRLRDVGVRFEPISLDLALERLRETHRVSDLAELISTFLRQIKGNGLTLAALREQAQQRQLLDARLEAFLKIFEPVWDRYETGLRSKGELDFEDMIVKAADYAATGRYQSPYHCILVDEFQDISLGRARLLKALAGQQRSHRLFCVGDDWQAIYRFAGSDISLMREFTTRFGYSATVKLDRTFRFNDQIERTATRFILKNPNQIPKQIEAVAKAHGARVFLHRPLTRDESVVESVMEAIDADFRAGGRPGRASVMLLGRYGFENIPLRELQRGFPQLALEFSTVHKAKGAEADYAVILGLRRGRYGFPSEVADDPLLEAVLAEPEDFPHAEERRLFYVALTRARHAVHVIVDRVAPSAFAMEIARPDYGVQASGQFTEAVNCPSCRTGHLVQQTSQYGVFYGCNNYPLCDYKTRPCPKCGAGLMRLEDTKDADVCTNKGCGYTQRLCPQCRRGRLVERQGRYGPFLGCSMFSKGGCNYTERLSRPASSRRS